MTDSDGEAAAKWRHYTMQLDLNANFKENPIEFAACSSEGILTVILQDFRNLSHRSPPYIISFFNIHTRCEVSRLSTESSTFISSHPNIGQPLSRILYMHVVNSSTIVMVFSSGRDDHALEVLVTTSADGFRTSTVKHVTVKTSDAHLMIGLTCILRPGYRRPHVNHRQCVTVGDGIVIGKRTVIYNGDEREHTYSLHYVSFADLLRIAAPLAASPHVKTVDYEPKWWTEDDEESDAKVDDYRNENRRLRATDCGLVSAIEDIHINIMAFGSTSVAVMKGREDGNAIHVHDLENLTLLRSISVNWASTGQDFYPALSLPLPFKEGRFVLTQAKTGAKMLLNVESGAVESVPAFVPVDQSGKDELFIRKGNATFGDCIFGWFNMEVSNEDFRNREAKISMTVIHLPYNRVHTLATLATNALYGVLNKETRMRITQEENPKNAGEYGMAISNLAEFEQPAEERDAQKDVKTENKKESETASNLRSSTSKVAEQPSSSKQLGKNDKKRKLPTSTALESPSSS